MIAQAGQSGQHVALRRAQRARVQPETPQRGVCTGLAAGSLGAIVGQFKGVCTKRAWAMGYRDFGWHRRFHDHVIRNDTSLDQIRQYVVENPLKWESEGRENVASLWM